MGDDNDMFGVGVVTGMAILGILIVVFIPGPTTEPTVTTYTLEDGTVLHNCDMDDFRYNCGARIENCDEKDIVYTCQKNVKITKEEKKGC